jgi:1,4-alpha-glucan branching enzyme
MYSILSSLSTSHGLDANLSRGIDGASFRGWAPHASAVKLLFQPDEQASQVSLELARGCNTAAYWSADIGGVAPCHLHQFAIQNRGGDRYDAGGLLLLRADPCAKRVSSSDPSVPSMVVDPSPSTFSAGRY